MANKHASLDALFTDIANAIREKTGETGTIAAAQIPSVIRTKFMTTIQLPATIISFTIKGTSYQAEEGMPWMVWCKSPYNTVPLSFNGTDDKVMYNSSSAVADDSGTFVSGMDVIMTEHAYQYARYRPGSGGGAN